MVKAMELQERRSELLFRHLQTTSSLCMGISDEIKFVTIAIYETTTLEIKATIALLFRSSFFFFSSGSSCRLLLLQAYQLGM